MLWLVQIALSAALVGPSQTAARALFAPPLCGYSVTFPAEAALAQSAAPEDQNVSAELLRNDVRFAAACIASSPAAASQSPQEKAALSQLALMAAMLGVQNVSIRPLEKLGPGCGEVDGFLGSEKEVFRITARICVEADTTFIAEATYHDKEANPEIRAFLESVSTRRSGR